MTPVILLLMIATMVTAIVAMLSYQRRSGVASGAGRGAPTSPVIPILCCAAAVVFAIVAGFLLRRGG
jgi:uncharacterized membrane protein YidH (DUF202 family)